MIDLLGDILELNGLKQSWNLGQSYMDTLIL
jgi:hypothetical protein